MLFCDVVSGYSASFLREVVSQSDQVMIGLHRFKYQIYQWPPGKEDSSSIYFPGLVEGNVRIHLSAYLVPVLCRQSVTTGYCVICNQKLTFCVND